MAMIPCDDSMICGKIKSPIGEAFKNSALIIVMYHFAGKIIAKYCNNLGMYSTGNTNPDKSAVGSNPKIKAI